MDGRLAVSLLSAMVLFPSLSAQAQEDFPDGPGKELVLAHCGGCHDINRVRAGYTPEGWRTVIRMMQNIDTPVPEGSMGHRHRVSDQELPGAAAAGGRR